LEITIASQEKPYINMIHAGHGKINKKLFLSGKKLGE